jgi:chromosome segregation and condensation protein ScpB/DNA-binding XRE family transcriptional regulator
LRDTPAGKGGSLSRTIDLVARTAVPDEDAAKVRGELSALARELRERRQLLGKSQVQLSQSSKVSRTVINEIEAGTRFPSVRTYARLRAALGLEPPAAAAIPLRLPLRLDPDQVTALCAGLLARHEASLADLASALGIAIPAVRENLERVAERLLPVGYTLTDDGGTVRLWPLPGRPSEVVRCLSSVEETVQPSPEQVGILGVVAYFGQITRTQIEAFRGEGDVVVDSASVLDRMVRQGLLAKVRSDRGLGAPYVYSVTGKAVRASGYTSVEAMREVIASRFTPAELAAIANAFEKDTARLTRGVRNGRRPPAREIDAAPELPDRLMGEGER